MKSDASARFWLKHCPAGNPLAGDEASGRERPRRWSTLPILKIAEIVAFLGTLTLPLPASFATAPILPPASVKRER